MKRPALKRDGTPFAHITMDKSQHGMILLLGASGYFGKAFASELRRRGHSFIPLTREAFDYTRFDFLFDYLRTMRPAFVINAAGYCCDAAENPEDVDRERIMGANALLPQMIARVCLMTKTPWGHVSSGSIYSGVKILENNRWRVEKDLGRADLIQQFSEHPEQFRGFSELDEPNYSFRHPPCDFYSGAKALAEEAIREIGESYIWRMREPFNERDEPCNLFNRLEASGLTGLNSLSHLEDSVRTCIDLWEYRAPYGIYNVVNPGALDIRDLSQRLQHRRDVSRLTSANLIMRAPDQRSRPNCILDASKLIRAGVKIRPLLEAVADSLDRLENITRNAAAMERIRPVSAAL